MKYINQKRALVVLLGLFIGFFNAESTFAASISYGGTGFTETAGNTGAVSGTVTATLTGDRFNGTTLSIPSQVSLNATPGGMPAGLTPSVAVSTTSIGTWNSETGSANNALNSITYGNGLFVAVGSSSGTDMVMTSPDGVTWTSRTAPSDEWQSVAFGNNLFVAVSVTGAAMTSPDGITWTLRTTGLTTPWMSVTYGNGLFVAVGAFGTSRVMTSPDGITWTPRTAASATDWVSVTYGNGLFVAVSLSPLSASQPFNRVMTSPDGINWTIRTAARNIQWASVTYGNGLFVATSSGEDATGTSTQQVMTSPDGITWTARTIPEFGSWTSVKYGNGLFVSVARSYIPSGAPANHQVMTSPDGITWTVGNEPEANDWVDTAYGNGDFVSVSNGGNSQVMKAVGPKDVATLTLAGNATNHASSNDVTDISFTFTNTAFTTGPAASVTNAISASSGRGINFNDSISLGYSGNFTETIANGGAVTGSRIVTLSGAETFVSSVTNGSPFVYGTHYTVSNVPLGLTAVLTKTSATVATLTLTGSATAHANANDVSNLTITFLNAAFTGGNASGVSNATDANGSIDFNDQPTLDYLGDFTETNTNSGAVSGSRVATLTGDTFATSLVGKYSIPNLPTGLTAVMTRTSATVATLTLTGSATAHLNANDLSNLTITFLNGAFVNTATASNVTGYTNTSGQIDFNDQPSLSYSGNFIESPSDDGSVTGERLITLLGGEVFATSLTGKYTVTNVPTGLTPVLTVVNNTQVKVTLTGNALAHANANDVSNLTITFQNGSTAPISPFFHVPLTSVDNISNASGSIDFFGGAGGPTLAYSTTTFTESAANNGAIGNTSTITLTGDTFSGSHPRTLTSGTDFTAINVPSGLTVSLSTIDSTHATLSLTGTAAAHANANDSANLTIAFTNAAFTTGPASSISGNTKLFTLDFTDPASIIYSGTFTETASNTGAVSGSRTATLTGDTFTGSVAVSGTFTLGTHYTVANVPTGLTAVLTKTSANVATLTLTGSATSHANANDVSNLTITFLNGAFANTTTASNVTGYTNATGGIDFTDGASIVYAGAFTETATNAGAVSGSRTATLTGDTFTGSVAVSGTFIQGTHYTVSNVPTGLTAVLTKTSTTVATLTLTGSATAHASANTLSNLTITFLNGAFTTNATASNVMGYTNNTGSITFTDPASIIYSGTFTETASNTGAVSGSRTATLTGDTFTGSVAVSGTFTLGTHYTVANVPTGLTAVLTKTSANVATLTLTGSATSHANANDVSNLTITFLNGAFANTTTASNVTGYTNNLGIVNFNDAQGIAYSGTTFSEATANDGSISTTVTLTLTGDTWTAASGAMTLGMHYSVSNVPAGLTVLITRTSTTTATLTLTGSATSHANTNDISNMSITFLNAAFTGGNASVISNSTVSTLAVDFIDSISVAFASATYSQSEGTTPLNLGLTVSGGSLSSSATVVVSATGGTATGSDTRVLYTLSNVVQTSANSFEYDMYITNTGTTTLALRGYAFGVNINSTYPNGGTLAHAYVAGSRNAAFSTLPAVTASATGNHVRATTTNATTGNEVILTAGVPYKLARMSVTTSASSFSGVNPFTNLDPGVDPIQVVAVTGKTQAGATVIVNPGGTPGTSFLINGIANPSATGTISGLTAVVSPNTAPSITSDYIFATPYTVVIPAGNYTTPSTISVPVVLVNDSIVESPETVTFSVSSPSGVVLGSQTTTTATITDNDAVSVAFSSATYSAAEGTSPATLTLAVSGGVLGTQATVLVDVTGGNATGTGANADYTFTSPTTVTIPAGDYTTTGTITVPVVITNDFAGESLETIIFTIGTPTGVTLGSQTTATMTITDNDTPGFTVATVGSSPLAEGTSSVAMYTIVLNTLPASNVIINVTPDSAFVTNNATAYTFTINNWSTPQQVLTSVPENSGINNISTVTTTFSVDDTLSDNAFTSLPDQTKSLAITDNDVSAEFASATYTVGEATSSMNLVLSVTGGVTSTNQTYDLTVTGTATSGTDFTFTTPVTIPAGTYTAGTTMNVPIVITNDSIAESTETAIFALANPSSNANIGTQSTTTLSITDNDAAALTYNGFFMENMSNGGVIKTSGSGSVVTISLSNASFSRSSGTFAQGTDYTVTNLPAGLTLSITANSTTTATVSVTGTATSHANSNSISNLTIAWTDSAFTGTPASVVTNSTYATIPVYFNDSDNLDIDGVDDTIELTGLNGGDANDNGISDTTEPNVTTLPTDGTNPAIGLAVSGSCSLITGAAQTTETGIGTNDSSYNFAIGLLDFSARCDTPTASGTMTIYYDQNYSNTSTWIFRKWNPTTHVWATASPQPTIGTHTYTTGPLAGTTVTTATFTITEGSSGDTDGIANGVIDDPIGPGIQVASSSSGGGGGGGGGAPKCPAGKSGVYPNCTSTPIVCAPGELFSPTTGLPCASQVFCAPGELFSSINGQACTTSSIVPSVPTSPTQPIPTSTTPTEKEVQKCAPYLTDILVYGGKNNPEQVKLLQNFLNTYEGQHLLVTGIYDLATKTAVTQFQEKYKADILDFWKLKKGNGQVYLVTQQKINAIVCGASKPGLSCPYFGLVKKGYLNGENIKKVQTFFNTNEGAKLVVNGIYDDALIAAINAYQNKNRQYILTPYKLRLPTGIIGAVTRKLMHRDIGCYETSIRLPNGVVLP